MRGFASIILVLIILAILAAFCLATGFYEVVEYGFSTPVTPQGTYIASIDFSGLDKNTVTEKLDTLAGQLNAEDLVIWVDDEEYYKIPLGDLGLEINTSALVDDVFGRIPPGFGPRQLLRRYATLRRGITIAIPFTLDDDKLRRFIQDAKAQSDRDVLEPFFDFENRCIGGGLPGRRLDVIATMARIPASLTGIKPLSLSAASDITEPKVTAADLKGIDPTNPMGTYTTKFNPRKRGRSYNIGLLASMFNGVVVKPAEQFSFNKISGPRTKESGFQEAPEYINHRIIVGYGGGSCQVSTTLYNAALLSGMRIEQRYPHSRVVDYVPFGRDATVNYTSGVDFKFTNILKHSIVIWSHSDIKAGWVTFEIFGHPDDRQNIEITNSYTMIMRDPSNEERIVDRSLQPGKEVVEDKGTNGIRVRTWRHYIQPDGSRITEPLYYDVIASVSRIVRYNPETGGDIDASSTTPDEKKKPEPTPPGEVYF